MACKDNDAVLHYAEASAGSADMLVAFKSFCLDKSFIRLAVSKEAKVKIVSCS